MKRYLLIGGGVPATLHNTAVAGCSHCLIGGYRHQEGWGGAVALWLLEWWAAGSATLLTSYQQGICHGACCIINSINAEVWFSALSPGHRTLTYSDVVIEHVDFYSSVHKTASSYVNRRNMPHKLSSARLLCCVV